MPAPPPDETADAGFTLVETIVASVILILALVPAVAAVLFVSADPTPRWTAEAAERAQAAAEQTLRLDPLRWADETVEGGPWRTRLRVSRSAAEPLVSATVAVWREGRGRGGSAAEPLVTLPIARLIPPPTPDP